MLTCLLSLEVILHWLFFCFWVWMRDRHWRDLKPFIQLHAYTKKKKTQHKNSRVHKLADQNVNESHLCWNISLLQNSRSHSGEWLFFFFPPYFAIIVLIVWPTHYMEGQQSCSAVTFILFRFCNYSLCHIIKSREWNKHDTWRRVIMRLDTYGQCFFSRAWEDPCTHVYKLNVINRKFSMYKLT